jgi:hypothetical protein
VPSHLINYALHPSNISNLSNSPTPKVSLFLFAFLLFGMFDYIPQRVGSSAIIPSYTISSWDGFEDDDHSDGDESPSPERLPVGRSAAQWGRPKPDQCNITYDRLLDARLSRAIGETTGQSLLISAIVAHWAEHHLLNAKAHETWPLDILKSIYIPRLHVEL